MTVPGEINQSRGRHLGDVAGGDHGHSSMARVQPVELAVPPDRVELGQEVFHEETGSQVDNIVRSVIQGEFDIVQTGDWPEPIGPVRPDAGEVHDPGDAIDSYRPGDGVGGLAVPLANVRGGKVGGGKPEEDVRPLGGSGKGCGVVRRGCWTISRSHNERGSFWDGGRRSSRAFRQTLAARSAGDQCYPSAW